MSLIQVEMTGDEARLWRSLQTVTTEQRKMERGFEQIQRQGQRAGRAAGQAFGGSNLASLKAYAGGLLSVSAAIGVGRRALGAYAEDVSKFSAEARKAHSEMMVLAALQEGGKKAARVRETEKLAVRYGLYKRRGEAYLTAQSMQSILETDWATALGVTENIFAATKEGLTIEEAKELAILGAGLKQPHGLTLPRAYIAGKAAGRTTKEVAHAAPALSYWEDVPAGIAAAAVLSGVVGAAEVKTYTKAGGEALSDLSGLRRTYKELGVYGATEIEKLRALSAAGIDTVKELELAGLLESRERKAMAGLIQNFAKVENVYRKTLQATPEVFLRDVLETEAEIPYAKTSRRREQLLAMLEDRMTRGPYADWARHRENEAIVRAIALHDLGMRRGLFGMPLIDEEGRAWPWAKWLLPTWQGEDQKWYRGFGIQSREELAKQMELVRGEAGLDDPVNQPTYWDEETREAVKQIRDGILGWLNVNGQLAVTVSPAE